MQQWLENLPKEASPLSQYYIGLSRKKESEEDYFGALTQIVKAKDEDRGNNRNFYLQEILRLNEILNKNDQIIKNEIAQLYKLKAIRDELPEMYVSAENKAEQLVKLIKDKDEAAINEVKGLMDDLDVHLQKTESFMQDIIEGRPVRDLSEPETVEEKTVTEEKKPEEKTVIVPVSNDRAADIEKIVEAVYQDETEMLESFAEDGIETMFFPTLFPEKYLEQFSEDIKQGNLASMVEIINSDLRNNDPAMFMSMVNVTGELFGNTGDQWFIDKSFEYLEEARINKLISEKDYRKKLKILKKLS